MKRVVPSVVLSLLDRKFHQPKCDPSAEVSLSGTPNRTALKHILDLAKEIPHECLGLRWLDFEECVRSLEVSLDDPNIVEARRRIPNESGQPGSRSLLVVFRELLASMPDEIPAHSTTELAFITDLGIRTVLRSDISSVNTALANGEWKAATVLAGSVVEALLLWAIRAKEQPVINGALDVLVDNRSIQKPRDQDPTHHSWTLHHYIVSERLTPAFPRPPPCADV